MKNAIAEAATQMCSSGKVFWKYAADLEENSHAMGVFLWLCCKFQNTFYEEHPWMAASVFRIIESSYDSRNETKFKSINIRNFRYGIVTGPFAVLRTWSSILMNHKKCNSVNQFKAKIKFWYPKNCLSKLRNNYIYQIGYM